MNRYRIFNIIILFSIVLSSTFAQTDSSKVDFINKFSKNALGFMSIGTKNTYGAWGGFYLRRIPLGKTVSRFRVGCGIKESFVIGGGLDFRLYSNLKKLELFYSMDYSYNLPGIIRYDNDRDLSHKTDSYHFSECHYLHTFISTHYLLRGGNASLQLKTGYAFLLNTVNVAHTSGPDEHYRSARRLTNGGLMIGLDFIVLFNRKGLK